MLALGIGMLFENQTRDISETKQIIGKIQNTKKVRKESKVGAYPLSAITESVHLIIELESKDKFATFNPEQNYSFIQRELTPGKQVKINYKTSFTQFPTNTILQLESSGQIIIDHKDFSKNHSIASIFIIAFGLICIGVKIWILKTKKLHENWS